jgi:hypothetical protein
MLSNYAVLPANQIRCKVPKSTRPYRGTKHPSSPDYAPGTDCSLNLYLHRFSYEESPYCECGSGAIENVQHCLLHCPKYERQRAKLVKTDGLGGMRIEKLLGYPKMITNTLKYVKETKRFSF